MGDLDFGLCQRLIMEHYLYIYPITCLPVRGEISRAIEDLVTLWAPVLYVDNHRAPAQ